MPCNHPKMDGQTDNFGQEGLPSSRRFRYPFNRGDPQRPVFGGPQLPSAHEPVKDACAPRPRGGSFVALLDCLSASGIFHLCPERGKAPFPGQFKGQITLSGNLRRAVSVFHKHLQLTMET
jgi:hypothetical protein